MTAPFRSRPAGTKFAFAKSPAKWVRLYVDVPAATQRDAAVAFATADTSLFGNVEQVDDATVEISGDDGRYELKVNDGQIMHLVTEAVLGGDRKTQLAYSNIHDPLHTTVTQGKTVRGHLRRRDPHKFELEDSNASFNGHFSSQGQL